MSKENTFEFERQFFENVKNIFEKSERTELDLKFRESRAKVASHSSILLNGSRVIIQVEEKVKSHSRFGVKKCYRKIIENMKLSFYELKSSNFLYINILSPLDAYNFEELFCAIYDDVFLKFSPDSFECCSRYMECSNKKQCVNPSKKLLRSCRYLKKIEQGIIFFGENKNV